MYWDIESEDRSLKYYLCQWQSWCWSMWYICGQMSFLILTLEIKWTALPKVTYWSRLPPADIEMVPINFKAWNCRAGHLGTSYLDSGSQNMSLYPSTWAQALLPSFKNLLAMLILRSFPRSTQSETLGWGYSNLFQQALQWSSCTQKFRIAGLELRKKEDLLSYLRAKLPSWPRLGLALGWGKHGG